MKNSFITPLIGIAGPAVLTVMAWVLPALALVALALPARAQDLPAATSPTGVWRTQDHGGVIAVTPCGDALCAHIAGVVLDHPDDPMPLDFRGVSQCGLGLINDAREVSPGLWRGHILDPRNGGLYGVELRLDRRGQLLLRGFLGLPLLGRTETWTRYVGPVPADCRLSLAPATVARDQPRVDRSG